MLRFQCRWPLQSIQDDGQFGEKLGDVRGLRAHVLAELPSVCRLDPGANQLHPGPIWRSAGLFVAPTPQYLRTAVLSVAR